MFSLFAPCFVCGTVFSSNPNLVPSHDNHPICESCIGEVNRRRREGGLAEWPVLPGAYEPTESI